MNADGIESSLDVSGQRVSMISRYMDLVLPQGTPASYHHPVPIHSLPNEILTEILSTAVSATSPGLGVIDVSQDIITLSHVCSYWHRLADQDARLWSTILIRGTTLDDKSRLAKYLRQSCAYPIHIIITPLHILDDDFRGCIVSLQPHMHRIKRLFVKMNNSWVMENVISRLTNTAPQLAELTLGLVQPESWVDALATAFDSRAPYCHIVASTLFGGNTPALRSLYLSSVSFPSSIVGNLHHLTLDDMFNRYEAVDELLDVLKKCSELESLTMRYVPVLHPPMEMDPEPPVARRADEDAVSLPALRRLVLAGQFVSYVSHFLARVSIPGPTKCAFHMMVNNAPVAHLDPGMFFGTCESTNIFSSLRILEACVATSGRLVVKGYTTDNLPVMVDSPATVDSEPAFTLEFLDVNPVATLSCLAPGLTRQPGEPTMHTLIVRGTPLNMSGMRWRHLLIGKHTGNLRTLRLVEIAAQDAEDFVSTLSSPGPCTPPERELPLLPYLATLVIVRPVGGFTELLRDALEKAVRYLSEDGKLETVELVQEPGVTIDWGSLLDGDGAS
ncbi:uncharacterized protein B0H18DRAFT_1006793 [Fomitopsis serialis]|uniref:uncharacterized protein n=1 Tax=Fomitopsis serialis TaxID=139415 RepID=UPI002007BF52|nr:uncharacterized protein B0H18DRAFT_1006793 [Neoantrodia serialis]KAH9926174.1 hypothetical protein B0H18DRAFT_1006793 [Neoantrodia serialis]